MMRKSNDNNKLLQFCQRLNLKVYLIVKKTFYDVLFEKQELRYKDNLAHRCLLLVLFRKVDSVVPQGI